ncbi:MAG: peptide ABC transporter substrate-binding protein [Chloroflexota bacterium]
MEPDLNQTGRPSDPGAAASQPPVGGWPLAPGDEITPASPASRARRLLLGGVALLLAIVMIVAAWPAGSGTPAPTRAADTSTVTILTGAPASIDPARHGDLGSAQFVSQLYETLTAVDSDLQIRPALAASWTVADGGTRVTFTLRPNLTFSDGSPLTARDVVHSWRRLFDPESPSPLASLIADVKGARDLLTGSSSDTSTLGVSAPDAATVVVDLERGGGDLPAIVSGAPFAVVPASVGSQEITPDPGTLVGSGAYTLERVDPTAWTLAANPDYWAGQPKIATVKMVTTLNGASPVDEFVAGNLDITQVGWIDAGWIAYDKDLGPSLRTDPSLSVTYYGFDATRAPFNDVRVRQAFAQAVDWRRLASLDEPGSSIAATSMVPKGIPGTPEGDFLPPYDPAAARALLADAGFPGGAGLAPVTFITNGGGYDGGIVAMLQENLGVRIDYATMDFGTFQGRLATDPPQIWSLSWVADFPGPNDFLGVLLGTGSTANEGGWSNADFDAAVATATSASAAAEATAAYRAALEIVKEQAPVVPVAYGTSYSLVRTGLAGASENGTGIIRFAGLAWGGN